MDKKVNYFFVSKQEAGFPTSLGVYYLVFADLQFDQVP